MDETFVLVLASGAVCRLRFTAGMVLPPWELCEIKVRVGRCTSVVRQLRCMYQAGPGFNPPPRKNYSASDEKMTFQYIYNRIAEDL